jgi:hypothetical protein
MILLRIASQVCHGICFVFEIPHGSSFVLEAALTLFISPGSIRPHSNSSSATSNPTAARCMARLRVAAGFGFVIFFVAYTPTCTNKKAAKTLCKNIATIDLLRIYKYCSN